jgi:four helix bundle protein
VVSQLKVWQKAHRLVLDTYRHAQSFPAEERYGLTAHLLKSATSVPSNIAEGCGRTRDTELAHFLGITAGSASETEYQLLLAHDLGYLAEPDHRAGRPGQRRQTHAQRLHPEVAGEKAIV